ncbi:MAG: hypothetical protein DRP15_00765 [Candidatus Aenigmatarchaeota archaeon]|nr:MAG: hypothetical protein DRP15_00765 [Candidatus Aenigmarchaeota archaeon]
MLEVSVIDGVIEKTNDHERHVNWSIDKPLTAIGEQSFTLNVSDSNGNSDILIYNFTVSVCREGDVRPCGTDEGICEFGNSTCINGVWSECVGGRGPEDEVCNGLDDNCDGIIDNIGVDPYMNSSVEDTKCWCYGGNLPRDEICNDIDDDCDGSIDEGIICCQPGETRPCGTDVGICQKGYETCIDGSWSGVCEGGVQPRDEICFNNLDDDCDGVVDELIEFVQNQERPGCLCRNGETRPCGSDIGECVPGYMVCENNRYDPKKCIGAIGPSPEICDGKDNDCDGEIDEGCVKKLDPTEINEIIQRYLSGEDPESISADLGISQDTVLSYINCANGEMDPETEEGVDCGGICPASCFDFSWLWLSFVGVVILIVLFILMRYFKSRGEELTWEALKKKWSEGV